MGGTNPPMCKRPRENPEMCTYFLQGLSYRVLSVPGKKFDYQSSPVSKLIVVPTPCCYGLDVTSNSCVEDLSFHEIVCSVTEPIKMTLQLLSNFSDVLALGLHLQTKV